MWNNPNDPMPIKIANGKTLQECIHYQGGGITVYTDNAVIVKTYPGFYDYYLANERKISEAMMLPVDGEEVVKDEEYYKKLINCLAIDYNKQVENTPNLYRNTMALQDVNTPAPIDFACTVFSDGQIWIGEGYSVGTADRPPCPVNVPTGKLAFVTNAGRRTHSLIIKGANNITSNRRIYKTSFSVESERFSFSNTTVGKVLSGFCSDGNYFSLDENGIKAALNGFPNDPQGGFIILNEDKNGVFSQLLIYKGNLTEAELKTENAKTIRLR